MNAIEVKQLVKQQGEFFTLRCPALTLPSGCIMGLVGRNGAGKSTLIHILLGMIRRDGGEVSLLDMGDAAQNKQILEHVGVVLDNAAGIPAMMRVSQVGGLMRGIYPHWDSATFERYLTRFDMPRRAKFGELSRGMRVKLNIAVALSHGARLLILDEATNGLDPLVRDEVLELLRDFVCDDSHAALISSHLIGDLERICDYVAHLRAGELVLCEEKDALIERYSWLRTTAEQLAALPSGAVLGKRENAFGADAIVLRTALPHGAPLIPVTLEEVFVSMEKEEVTP